MGISPRESGPSTGRAGRAAALALVALPCIALLTMGPGAAARTRGRSFRVARPAADATNPVGLVAGAGAAPAPTAGCPRGTLPDGDACVTLPDDDDLGGASEPEVIANAHHDRHGRYVSYAQIPRRPERPADYDAYRYPVPCEAAKGCVFSGYDLDRPDDEQRRGRGLRYVGHGAVDLAQKRGTPVTLVPLEHQVGDAEVVYTGPLFGTTVITRHTLREGGELRDYLLLFGHLDLSGVQVGAHLAGGDLVGLVGDTGSAGLVHLHLEARRVRPGVDVGKLARSSPWALIADENSIVCDPRNVLPLR